MQNGSFVRVNYVGRLESGEIFDLTDEAIAQKEKVQLPNVTYRPLAVIVGAHFLIPGLDKALLDMKVGDKRTVDITPEEGFGQRNPELVHTVAGKAFEGQMDPKPGMIVDFSGMKGRIQSVEGGRVRIDFNNPLAGKQLKYDIEVTEEITDPTGRAKGILEFFGAGGAEVIVKGNEVIVTGAFPQQMKERVSSVMLQHLTGIETVVFQERYQKKNEAEAKK